MNKEGNWEQIQNILKDNYVNQFSPMHEVQFWLLTRCNLLICWFVNKAL